MSLKTRRKVSFVVCVLIAIFSSMQAANGNLGALAGAIIFAIFAGIEAMFLARMEKN